MWPGAGSRDHYAPVEQFARQVGLLSKARTVTARLFTEAEQAQNHIHIGLSLDVVADWLDKVPHPATHGSTRVG